LENLKFLGLFGNQIKEINFKIFEPLKSLEKLTIADNPFYQHEAVHPKMKIEILKSIKTLKYLDEEFIS
jgi:hypothetical protein